MPGKPRFDVDEIRDLVRQRLESVSTRELAAEIGISRGGLESVLDGREPYARNRLKLAAWALRQRGGGAAIARPDVDAAIALLEQWIDSTESKAVRERRSNEIVTLFSRKRAAAE